MPVVLIPGSEFPIEPEVLDEADLVLDTIEALDAEVVAALG